MRRPGPGRPPKYGPAVVERILQALREGCTWTAAAGHAGINYSTFKDWQNTYPEFSAAVERAEAEAEHFATTVVVSGMKKGSTEDAKWWLGRRRHADWGDKAKVEHSGKDGGPIEFTIVFDRAESEEVGDAGG